jgi:hypothetical protein
MAGPKVADADLVETFIGQTDRNTHSRLKLRDCFSRTAFDLVFQYGSVLQITAVRQALIACILLPAVDHPLVPSVRHKTFEKHLDNLLVHVLSTVASDGTVASYDRDIANLLVETAADRKRTPIVTDKEDQEATADIDTIARQLDHQLKKVLGVRD